MRNTLILIEQIGENQHDGRPLYEALIEATVHRTRPVVLTAIAGMLAFSPLTLTALWGPMAITLIGGFGVGTILTLLVLPALYALWFKVKKARPAIVRRARNGTGVTLRDMTTDGSPVALYPDFLDAAESFDWLARSQALAWKRDTINMYGKTIPVPREEALFGDDLSYQYRGATIAALPWPDFLLDARDRIEAVSDFRTNFAVGNRYLTGKDSIGWHSDSFPQIGDRPAIASLSLGSTRLFKLRRKEGGPSFDFPLESGTLLIMLPGYQDEWVHAIPKTARPVGERINWTFRPHVDAQG